MTGTVLLLVGDGPERARVEELARARGVRVVATGTVPHAEIPGYLAAMDVGLVLAAADQKFHYSPLKLAEYVAAGVPLVVPHVPNISGRLVGGRDALLVPPGDVSALAEALRRIRDEPQLRQRLARHAHELVHEWTWDRQVERVLAALENRSP